MNLGLSSVHTLDELGSIFISTNRIGSPTDGSNWISYIHCIGEVTLDRVIWKIPEKDYSYKTDFETRRGGVINQYFVRQYNSMSRPPLDSTPLVTNKKMELLLVQTQTMEQRHQLNRFQLEQNFQSLRH